MLVIHVANSQEEKSHFRNKNCVAEMLVVVSCLRPKGCNQKKVAGCIGSTENRQVSESGDCKEDWLGQGVNRKNMNVQTLSVS